MAVRKPLVVINGQVQEIPAGDTMSAASSEVDVVSMTNANAGALVKGTPVYVSAAGAIDKASAGAAGTRKVLGLMQPASTAAAAAGLVQTDGILTATTAEWDAVTGGTGGLIAGSVYYLDPATAGMLTTTAPTAAGQYVCEVGIALSTTDLEIDTNRNGILLS